MKKNALIILILTLISKVFGFLREIILSYYYGTSSVSDVYLIAITIPTVIIAFIGAGITTGFIPMYSKVVKLDGKKSAQQFMSNLLNIFSLIFILLSFFCFIFAPQIVKVFAIGFTGETFSQAIMFTRITLVGMMFTSLMHLFNGYLQIHDNFGVPALVGFPLNIVVIISIILSSKVGLILLPIGIFLGSLAQFLFLLPFVFKKGYTHKWTVDLKDQRIKEMLWIATPVIFGTAINEINILVDRTMASQIVVGGITALNYANRLNNFVQSIFVISIATALYPTISKMIINNNMEGFKKTLTEAVAFVFILVIPATIGSIVFASPIINLLFGRGAFNEEAIAMTSSALVFYSIGMIGIGLRHVLIKSFYSMQDTKTPTINAAIGMTLNIVLNFVLSRLLGIGGLALATSIAALFTTFLLLVSLRKKIGPFGMKQISISFLKILFASLVMGGLAKMSFNYLTASLSQNLSLLLAIGVGAVSYFVIIYFMKIEDVDVIVGAIKKKFGRGLHKL